jgi:hypothetical protein
MEHRTSPDALTSIVDGRPARDVTLRHRTCDKTNNRRIPRPTFPRFTFVCLSYHRASLTLGISPRCLLGSIPVPGGYIHDSPELPPRSRPPMLAPRGACRGGEVGGLARSGSSALRPTCLSRMAAAEREIRQESRPHAPVRSCPLLTAPTSLPTTLSTPHVAATWTRLKSTSQR